jgi:hypothetical protein
MASGVLALSTAVLVFAPMADAIAESRSTGAVAHVENFGTDGCPLAHEHDACQLCRVIRLAGAVPGTAPHFDAPRRIAMPPADAADVCTAVLLFGRYASRAPPGRFIA